jgi:hypothetical protein
VVVGISHPEVILSIFDAQAVLKSGIQAFTINVAKTKEVTTAADSSHWQIVN